jgi:hypothetical protein
MFGKMREDDATTADLSRAPLGARAESSLELRHIARFKETLR